MSLAKTDSQQDRRKRTRWQRLVIAVPLALFGAAMAVFMGISVFLENMTDDFFGMCVAAMVSVFGMLMVREAAIVFFDLRPPPIVMAMSSYHLPLYARSQLHPHGTPADPDYCAALIRDRWQCENKRGHGPEGAFCKRHALARETARTDEAPRLETKSAMR